MPSDSDNEEPPALVALTTSHEIPHERVEATDGSAATPLGRAPLPPPTTSATRRPVPVCLITGFLGAGKSTLINYILTAKHGFRCAVLLNEWADSAGAEG